MRGRRVSIIVLAGVLLAALMMSAAGCMRRQAGAHLSSRLAREFEYASRLIRRQQQPAGYWFTQHTTEPVFTRASPEVNVFVPAIMVELLTPIADETGLGDVLQRARSFLSAQIEETGLVRYHGRTTQPYLPKYGCAISPDLDDTTTIWAVAPPPALELLVDSAIQTIKKYRSGEGLYRTWLVDQA